MWRAEVSLVICLSLVVAIVAVTDKQFNDLNNVVQQLKKNYDAQSAQLKTQAAKLNSQANQIKSQTTKLNAQTAQITAKTKQLNSQAALLKTQTIRLASQDKQLKAQTTLLNTQNARFKALARQVSQQQLYTEEISRASGDSGMKVTRMTRFGSKSYFSSSFNGPRVAAIHDHGNYRDTVGMGEFVGVLNGVEFRTRHNDYRMMMPSRTKMDYGKVEQIPYPEVPPEVLKKTTLDQQIQEMREWFKAWKSSDYSKRDYRKYFKANLCYLEGMWTNANGDKLEEPFASDRHAIAAESFFDLQEKIAYTSATGGKSLKENFAYLPTKISDVDDHGNVKYAQWNYKILCHPLKRHVPLTRFRLHDDLAVRVAEGKSLEDHLNSRNARFALYDDARDVVIPYRPDRYTRLREGSFLDNLMMEIPGKDNYPADVQDNSFNNTAFRAGADPKTSKPLNVGYYHNMYKLNRADAMGTSYIKRGYSDTSLYVAFNTRDKITPSKTTDCVRNYKCSYKNGQAGKCTYKFCTDFTARVSYAVPLEIIYTTPLQTWNPYNFTYYSDVNMPATKDTGGKYKRNGGKDKKMAYHGISRSRFYQIPAKFFEDSSKSQDAADTSRGAVGVLDPKGQVQLANPSGIHIHLKNIPGVGAMRTRYPIMPIHEAGNNIYKELEALKDMTLLPHKYNILYPNSKFDNGTAEQTFTFELRPSTEDPPGYHIHTVDLTVSDIAALKSGKGVTVHTSTDSGHDHELELKMNKAFYAYIRVCDGTNWKCWDGHKSSLTCVECRFNPFKDL